MLRERARDITPGPVTKQTARTSPRPASPLSLDLVTSVHPLEQLKTLEDQEN